MNNGDLEAKLTRYAHLLFSCANKHEEKASTWLNIALMTTMITAISFFYFSININWLFLVTPVIAFFCIKSIFNRSMSNKLFDMLRSAHSIKSGETVDAMFDYVNSRYNQQ